MLPKTPDDTSGSSIESSDEAVCLQQCFGDILNADITKALSPSLLETLLGYAIPQSSIACTVPIDYREFVFPLGYFREAFYLRSTDCKLMKREGFSIYTSKGHPDSDNFFFTAGTFSYNGLKESTSFMTHFLPESWLSYKSQFESLRLPLTCSVRNCKAARIMSFQEIRETKAGAVKRLVQESLQLSSDPEIAEAARSAPVDLNDHEVVFKQKLSGVASCHNHSICDGSTMRAQLPYNINNLAQAYSAAQGLGKIDESAVEQRCDILKLPISYKPCANLLRQQKEAVGTKSTTVSHQPVQAFAQMQQAMDKELGGEVLNQSARNATVHQVRNDFRRQDVLTRSGENLTPWRLEHDVQNMEPTNTVKGEKVDMKLRLSLAMARCNDIARQENPKNAAIMTSLGLQPGLPSLLQLLFISFVPVLCILSCIYDSSSMLKFISIDNVIQFKEPSSQWKVEAARMEIKTIPLRLCLTCMLSYNFSSTCMVRRQW